MSNSTVRVRASDLTSVTTLAQAIVRQFHLPMERAMDWARPLFDKLREQATPGSSANLRGRVADLEHGKVVKAVRQLEGPRVSLRELATEIAKQEGISLGAAQLLVEKWMSKWPGRGGKR